MVNIRGSLFEIRTALLLFNISIDIYIFGSSLHSKLPNDIDVLIVYNCEDKLPYIKNAFIALSLEYPLDIYYVTYAEVDELDFINKTSAFKLSAG